MRRVKRRSRRAPDPEEDLVKELADLGPCIAVGDPSETLPDLGASRIYLNDEWQLHVAGLVTRSQLIVFRMGSQSPGFWWEVDRVRQTVSRTRRLLDSVAGRIGRGSGTRVRTLHSEAHGAAPLRAADVAFWRPHAALRSRVATRVPNHVARGGERQGLAEGHATRDLIIQRTVLGAVALLAAVQIYLGALSPTDLVKNSLLDEVGSGGSSGSAKSAAFLASAVKDANASLPKQIDLETLLGQPGQRR